MITALRAAVVLLIVWGWAAHATAQATDSFPIQNFAILDWGGSLFIEGEYQEKSDKRGTSSQRTDESDLWMQEGIAHNEADDKARAAGLKVVMSRCMMKEYMGMMKPT